MTWPFRKQPVVAGSLWVSKMTGSQKEVVEVKDGQVRYRLVSKSAIPQPSEVASVGQFRSWHKPL